MKKTVTAVAVFALGASLAFAGPHGGAKGHRGNGAFEQKFAQKLNLTDAQKEQIRQIRTSFREQNKAFFEQARATREQVREARKANDTAKLEALRPTIESQRLHMQSLRETETAQIRAILTPEQRAQLDAWKAERGNKRRQPRS